MPAERRKKREKRERERGRGREREKEMERHRVWHLRYEKSYFFFFFSLQSGSILPWKRSEKGLYLLKKTWDRTWKEKGQSLYVGSIVKKRKPERKQRRNISVPLRALCTFSPSLTAGAWFAFKAGGEKTRVINDFSKLGLGWKRWGSPFKDFFLFFGERACARDCGYVASFMSDNLSQSLLLRTRERWLPVTRKKRFNKCIENGST